MTDITYPTRCQIVNADGLPYKPQSSVKRRTPKQSRPHIGKKGTAEWLPDEPHWGMVKITLDDGSIIWGHECWWIPIEESKDA